MLQKSIKTVFGTENDPTVSLDTVIRFRTMELELDQWFCMVSFGIVYAKSTVMTMIGIPPVLNLDPLSSRRNTIKNGLGANALSF